MEHFSLQQFSLEFRLPSDLKDICRYLQTGILASPLPTRFPRKENGAPSPFKNKEPERKWDFHHSLADPREQKMRIPPFTTRDINTHRKWERHLLHDRQTRSDIMRFANFIALA